MLKIGAMSSDEMTALLRRRGFGHLGCARDGHPYVVPMHYAYDGRQLYFLTTEGTKTEFIAANHEVCFQVEEIIDLSNWRSVILIGKARRIAEPEALERAMQLFTDRNPTLTPAINKTDIGAWHRQKSLVIYRVEPTEICGRQTAP